MDANTESLLLEILGQLAEAEVCPIQNIKVPVPACGGLYAVWERCEDDFTLIYIGETTLLQHRIDEMTRLLRHGFVQNFSVHRNLRLEGALSRSTEAAWRGIFISFLPVPLGRKEAEEYAVARWRPPFNHVPLGFGCAETTNASQGPTSRNEKA